MKLLTTNHKLPTPGANRLEGFTVIELLIATTVFSLVLLVSLIGFLQIGQIFYKGLAVTQTSQTARQLGDALKQDIAFNASATGTEVQSVSGPGGGQVQYFCAGPNRYTFKQGVKLDAANQDIGAGKFGLIKDSLTTTGCPAPYGSGSVALNKPTELLGNKMRVSQISVNKLAPPNDKLYNLSIRIVYGDDDVLANVTTPTTTKCLSGGNSSRYCYVYELKTTVRSGF